MEWGYEEKYDLLGIMLKEYKKEDYDRSEEVTAGFIVDILKDGSIGAIEILDWSRECGLRPHQVKDMNIDVEIKKGEFSALIIVKGEYKGKKHSLSGGIFL